MWSFHWFWSSKKMHTGLCFYIFTEWQESGPRREVADSGGALGVGVLSPHSLVSEPWEIWHQARDHKVGWYSHLTRLYWDWNTRLLVTWQNLSQSYEWSSHLQSFSKHVKIYLVVTCANFTRICWLWFSAVSELGREYIIDSLKDHLFSFLYLQR